MATAAVIGAGIGGLRAAEVLVERGFAVSVFDKGRGPGGRTASRHRPEMPGHDHGAQYLTAKAPSMLRRVMDWKAAGNVAEWTAPIGVFEGGEFRPAQSQTRWVGTPSMRAMAVAMAQQLSVTMQVKVTFLEKGNGRFRLWSDATDLGAFDRLVINAPAEQAASLLASVAPELSERAEGVLFEPCWAVMLVLKKALRTELGAAFVNEGSIAWWANEASKPSRPPGNRVLVHLNMESSHRLLEAAPEVVVDEVRAALQAQGLGPIEVENASVHRWRLARPAISLSAGALFNAERTLAVAGDWTGDRGRIESAYEAGESAGRGLV